MGGYSYGMRQRLGVAASLLREPELLVLDEPANGLDPAGIRDMRALVKRLAASGLTVLLSSHDMAEVEEICDNVTIMNAAAPSRSTAPSPSSAPWHPTPATCSPPRTTSAPSSLAGHHPAVRVERDPEGALVVTGARPEVSAYVAELVRADIELLGFTATRTPLEALFFMLTDDATHQTLPASGPRPSRRRHCDDHDRAGRTGPDRRDRAGRRRAGFGAALRWELRKLRRQAAPAPC